MKSCVNGAHSHIYDITKLESEISTHTSMHKSMYTSMHMSVHVSIYVHGYSRAHMSMHISIRMSMHGISMHASVCVPMYMSTCLFVC